MEPLHQPSRAPHQPPAHFPKPSPPYVFKEYEVKCPETFAWYQGYIKDLVVENGVKKLKVQFPDDWKEEQIINLEDIRPAPDFMAQKNWVARLHENCEAQAKSAPHEPYGWWGCKIQSAKEGLYLINFTGWGDIHNEILGPDMLRPANTNPNLSKHAPSLHSERVPIPKELHDYARTHTNELCRFVRLLPNILHFGFETESGSALIIGDKESLRRAKQLLIRRIDDKRDIYNLERAAQQKKAKLEEKAKKFNNAHVEKWTIQNRDLIKYVFGRSGKNIKKAKEIDGVIEIQVQDKDGAPATVSIYAELGKEEAAWKAREQLEIILATFPVPASCMGAIIGQKGQTIAEITQKSEVIRIKSWDKWTQERGNQHAGETPESFYDQNSPDALPHPWGDEPLEYFVIIGKKSCVLTARLMIEQKAQHKLEQDKVLNESRELDIELDKMQGTRGGNRRGPRGRGRG